MSDWWIPVTTTLAFFVMFVILHWTAPMIVSKIFGKHHLEVFEQLPDTYQTYWRRLVRSQVYYMYAGVVGVILITVEYRSVDELLFKYHRFIEVYNMTCSRLKKKKSESKKNPLAAFGFVKKAK